jgi:hypothetical protein
MASASGWVPPARIDAACAACLFRARCLAMPACLNACLLVLVLVLVLVSGGANAGLLAAGACLVRS